MYVILASNQYKTSIESIINALEKKIFYSNYSSDINLEIELDKLTNSTNYLSTDITTIIIDIDSISFNNDIPKTLKEFRQKFDYIRIIILANNKSYGDILLHKLVSFGIYDIINILDNNIDYLSENLITIIKKPLSFSKSSKWVIDENELFLNCKDTKQANTIIQEKIIGSITIAVTGSINRIGTSHIAISIANYFSINAKVAIVELNNNNIFEDIKNISDGVKETNEYFILNNIHFYNNKSNLTSLFNKDYNYIIFDMGTYNNCNKKEFLRSDYKLIISGARDWEFKYLEEILIKEPNCNNKYLFNFVDKERFKEIKRNMGHLESYMIPVILDPFKINNDVDDFYNDLFKSFISTKMYSRNFLNLFKKF